MDTEIWKKKILLIKLVIKWYLLALNPFFFFFNSIHHKQSYLEHDNIIDSFCFNFGLILVLFHLNHNSLDLIINVCILLKLCTHLHCVNSCLIAVLMWKMFGINFVHKFRKLENVLDHRCSSNKNQLLLQLGLFFNWWHKFLK